MFALSPRVVVSELLRAKNIAGNGTVTWGTLHFSYPVPGFLNT
jgi:hypothetical protein